MGSKMQALYAPFNLFKTSAVLQYNKRYNVLYLNDTLQIKSLTAGHYIFFLQKKMKCLMHKYAVQQVEETEKKWSG